MTPSNTPHRLAREATAAETTETTKDLPALPPYLYGREVGANERVYTPEQMRTYALAAIASDRASLALPQLEEQQRNDAAKYRFLLARMKVGAVQTQLPLNRVAYWYGFEDCHRPQDADEAIEAQMVADYEQGKGTAE